MIANATAVLLKNADIFPIKQFDWPSENSRRPCPPEFERQHNEHILKENGWELSSGEPSDAKFIEKKKNSSHPKFRKRL